MLTDYDVVGIRDVMGLAKPIGNTRDTFGFKEERPKASDPSGWFVPDEAIGCEPIPLNGSALTIEQAVESGLPRRVLRHLAERIAGGDKAKVATLEWGIVPKTTLERRASKLSLAESERTERVARVFVHARRALGSEEEARVFILASHPELDGRTPFEAARTDLGTRRVERILNALEYGLSL